MVSNSKISDNSTASEPRGYRRGRPRGSGSVTSDAVRLTRQALAWTQQKMAGELECSLSAISKLEQERRLPGQKKLSDRFNVLAERAGVKLLASDLVSDQKEERPQEETQ